MYGSLLRKQALRSDLSESYRYDSEGRLQSAISEGMRYEYAYYPNGLLKSKSASGRILLQYSYDLNSNKIEQTDVTGKTTTYHYNLLEKLTEINDNNTKESVATYSYYPCGSLQSLKQLNGLEIQYTYDQDKNLKSLQVQLEGKIQVNHYDAEGLRHEIEENGKLV